MLILCRCLLIGFILLDLGGCSTLFGKHNFVTQRETEYLHSQATPPLQVTAGLNKTNIGDDYVIPAAMTSPPTQAPGLLPPGSLAEKIATGAVPATVLKEKIPSPTATTSNSADNNTRATNNNTAGPILTLDQNITTAWSKVGDSLKQAGYIIANQNKTTGIYYIIDAPSTFDKVKMDTPIYQLHMQNTNNVVQIYITDSEGRSIATKIAQRILDDLKNTLAGKKPSTIKRFLQNVF
jgi:uncharacterized lipoprotein